MAEDRAAGHQNVCPRGDQGRRGLRIHAPVHRELTPRVALPQHGGSPAHLVHHLRDKGLAAETRVDSHDKHDIEGIDDL